MTHKFKRRIAGAIALFSIIVIIGNKIAQAQFFSDDYFFPGNFIPSPNGEFSPERSPEYDGTYERFSEILQDLIQGEFGPLASEIEAIVESSLGSLGISDTHLIESLLKSLLESNSDEFDLDKPPVLFQVEEYSKQINRQQIDARSHAVLGQSGQETIQLNLDQIQEDIFTVGDIAQVAQGDIATQDVTKRLASQLSINSQLLGSIYSEAINGRIDTQLQAEVLVDLADTLAADQKRQIRQELTATTGVFTAASQVMLSITPSAGGGEL